MFNRCDTQYKIYDVFLILILSLVSCSSSKPSYIIANSKYKILSTVDIILNPDYRKNVVAFDGHMFSKVREDFIDSLEKEFNTKISKNKSVLINYSQKGNKCFHMDGKDLLNVLNNKKNISSRISKQYNIMDFFVYTKDVYDVEIYRTQKNYNEDSGYLKDNIFTLEEYCQAFFILKPNGDFLKFYGSDYFTEVTNFLDKE